MNGIFHPYVCTLPFDKINDQLNVSSTFFSSKLDFPVIKTLERIRFFSNQNIGEGESNLDETNVEEMFN